MYCALLFGQVLELAIPRKQTLIATLFLLGSNVMFAQSVNTQDKKGSRRNYYEFIDKP